MIGNNTPAAGPQELQSTQQVGTVFFGPNSISQTSQTFKVSTAPFFLSAYALQNGDAIAVQQVIGSGSGTETAPFCPVIAQATLTPTLTCLRIDYPGRYQLVHTGPSALGTFTVVGAPQVMASDSLAGLAQGLAAVVSNLGTTVTGTLPIAVTSPSPLAYNVSLNWAYTDLGTITGSPINIDWTISRAFKITSNVGGLLNINIGGVLPASAGFCWIQFVQGASGIDALQFTGSSPINGTGTIQPATGVGKITLYALYFDGTSFWLDDFYSNSSSIGRFSGSATDYVGGDNAIRGLATIPQQYGNYATAAGTDTYTCTFSPAIAGLVTGVVYNIKFTNANTGAATLNANGTGAVTIQRRGVAVTAGQIPALSTLSLLFDGVRLQIMGAA